MNIRQLYFSGLAMLLQIPVFVYADGLVPCGGDGEEACQMCHAVQLVVGTTGWLVGILSIVAAILFIVAGFRILTAQGNPGVLQQAKSMIVNVAIGFVIILSAWLLIDLLMKTLVGEGMSEVGPWNRIACVDQPESEVIPAFVGFPTPNSSRGTAYDTGVGIDPTILTGIANLSADEADAAIVVAAAQAGLDAEQVRNMQALMRVESGGCRNNVSPVGALGCMQIMPTTAAQYDPALRNMSPAAVRAQLLDPNYNIALGARIYADLYERFDGNETMVFAGYNGGPGSLQASSDCPGLARYQCVWDSPGCYNTGRTDCTPNTGYIETRNYVEKVAAVAREL